jgi:PilZ domain
MSQHQQPIGSERRGHKRFEDLHASLVQLGGDNNGIVLNISEGGMAVLFADEVDVSNLRALRFQAPEFEHWMDINAEVAWISENKKQAGIHFKDLSDTTRTQLRAGISIATTRARRAAQAKSADAATELGQNGNQAEDAKETIEIGDATTASSGTPVTAEPPAGSAEPTAAVTANPEPHPASESESIGKQAKSNSLKEIALEPETALHSGLSEASQDIAIPEERQEIDLRQKATSSAESKKDARPQRLPLTDAKPQKTSSALALDATASPLVLQKRSIAEMPWRSLSASSIVKQPAASNEGVTSGTAISYGKWIIVSAITVAASLLAFFVGWVLGDPNRVKLGH